MKYKIIKIHIQSLCKYPSHKDEKDLRETIEINREFKDSNDLIEALKCWNLSNCYKYTVVHD